MSMMPVDAALAEFKPDDYTVRLLQGIFKVVPYSPALPQYRVIEDACKAVAPNGDAVLFAKARLQSSQQDIQDVLWMARTLDTADKGYAVFTGLKSAFNLFRGGGSDALETDTQQRNDAVLKALGISYMVYNAFPGTIAEKAEAFRSTPSGQALAMYFAAIEIALPFADNAATTGGNFLQGLFSAESTAQLSRLSGLTGGRSLEGVGQMLGEITAPLQRVLGVAAQYTKPIAETAQQYVPGALGHADKAAGLVANAADVMPVYTFLGARLAAEGAVLRAMRA